MRLIRQFLSALLGAAIFAAVLLGAVAPASAHDVAESTSPATGATVATPPKQVSVTFSENPLALGAQIVVNTGDGANWADGAVEIVDNVASQRLKPGAPAGLYTVAWRVAGSDGHPIEGTFAFAATAGVKGSTAVAAVPTMGTAQPGITTAPEPPVSSAEPFPWSIVIFVATAIGILVVLALMARRRLTGRDGQGGTVRGQDGGAPVHPGAPGEGGSETGK